jgi:hypothetical protein
VLGCDANPSGKSRSGVIRDYLPRVELRAFGAKVAHPSKPILSRDLLDRIVVSRAIAARPAISVHDDG